MLFTGTPQDITKRIIYEWEQCNAIRGREEANILSQIYWELWLPKLAKTIFAAE